MRPMRIIRNNKVGYELPETVKKEELLLVRVHEFIESRKALVARQRGFPNCAMIKKGIAAKTQALEEYNKNGYYVPKKELR